MLDLVLLARRKGHQSTLDTYKPGVAAASAQLAQLCEAPARAEPDSVPPSLTSADPATRVVDTARRGRWPARAA